MHPVFAVVVSTERTLGASSGPDLGRYLAVCGGLILLVCLLGFAFRRLLAGTLRERAARRSVRILDALPLGGKSKFLVVRCYDRTFALGVGEREVSLLAELDAETEEAEQPLKTPLERADFEHVLTAARSRLASPVPARPRFEEVVV